MLFRKWLRNVEKIPLSVFVNINAHDENKLTYTCLLMSSSWEVFLDFQLKLQSLYLCCPRWWPLVTVALEHLKCSAEWDGRWGFPDGPLVKSLSCNTGNTSSIPGLGRSHKPRSNKAHEPQLLGLCSEVCALQEEKQLQWEACVRHGEAPAHHNIVRAWVGQQRPGTAKNS